MVFNEGYEDFLEKIADKNIEFSFPESAKHILSLIEPVTTIEALTRFVGYVIAVRDKIEASVPPHGVKIYRIKVK
jgi:hypothetical protein